MRADVLRLLSQMAAAALAAAKQVVADNRQALARVAKGKHAETYRELVVTADKKISGAEKLLEAASYTRSLGVRHSLGELGKVIDKIEQIESLCEDLAQAQKRATKSERRHLDLVAESERRHQEVVQKCSTFAEERQPSVSDRYVAKGLSVLALLAILFASVWVLALVGASFEWAKGREIPREAVEACVWLAILGAIVGAVVFFSFTGSTVGRSRRWRRQNGRMPRSGNGSRSAKPRSVRGSRKARRSYAKIAPRAMPWINRPVACVS